MNKYSITYEQSLPSYSLFLISAAEQKGVLIMRWQTQVRAYLAHFEYEKYCL